MRFSQRMGLTPVRQAIQKDDMDADLRNGLWSVLHKGYLDHNRNFTLSETQLMSFVETLWIGYFNHPVDEVPHTWGHAHKTIRHYYFNAEWYQVYDLIEFIVQHSDSLVPKYETPKYTRAFNNMLKRGLSGYRFISDTITPTTSEEEVASIETSLKLDGIFAPVEVHLNQALKLLSDRQQPDYKNSVKESISAVESMASLIAGRNKAELAPALDRIKSKLGMHTAFADALKKLYNYASDEDGIRHAALEETSLDQEDAIFMLVSCSAFVNYLKVKADKAGIPLTPVA